MVKESLSDKIVFENAIRTFKGEINSNQWIAPKDVKEKIQNAQKRLKEEIYEDDLLGWRNKEVLKHYSKIIDKIFKEEFGDELTNNKK